MFTRNLATTAMLISLFSLAVASGAEPTISFEKVQLSKQFFGEGANVGDFNRDGKMDIVSGPFWYAGPAWTTRHVYTKPIEPIDPHGYSKCFLMFVDDFNGDGWPDILNVGFPGEDVSWFENPAGKTQDWTRHLALDHVDSESPAYVSLLGNGRRQLVCINNGCFGYARPDSGDANRPWQFHAISPTEPTRQRFTHGLGIGDVNGDGRCDLLEKDGWWEQPATLDGDPVWQKHAVNFGEGGAQMFAFDVNGDGRSDVVTSLQAHGFGLAWFEQHEGGTFEKHRIVGATPADNAQGICFSQPHAIAIAPIASPDSKDMIVGKRYWAHGPDHDPQPNAPAMLYWFQARPGADGRINYVGHQVDNDSGVGTQVVAADVNGDGLIDIVVGNKKGTFVFLQKRSN
jgi:hypothetical protein